MNEDTRNLILAFVTVAAILIGYYIFIVPVLDEGEAESQAQSETAQQDPNDTSPIPQAERTGAEPEVAAAAQEVSEAPRVAIESQAVRGSLSLVGARLDDLDLLRYRVSTEEDAPVVTWLRPTQSDEGGHYAVFGWQSGDSALRGQLPNPRTRWQTQGERLTPDSPVNLVYEAAGLRFTRTVAMDENYMFTITDRVENTRGQPVSLNPYGVIFREGVPERDAQLGPLYTGPLGWLNGELQKRGYKKLLEGEDISTTTQSGWLGFTDKYWLTALIPTDDRTATARLDQQGQAQAGAIFRASLIGDALSIPAGETVEHSYQFFAGAKKVGLIDEYASQGVERFDLAVDWGILWFLTKPFFYALSFFGELTGNFGVAILIVTLIVRILLFPLANKSFASMAKMRKVQPEIKRIQERFKDDRAKMQQEMMAFYKREKVNPFSGCLLLLPQLPIFFAFYKVLFVTIEMRHAPFFGWIEDLSAPDPTSWVNLFGLLPFSSEPFTAIPLVGMVFAIGAWPMIMGITMWFNQLLNPQPTDPMQARIMAFLPVIFTVIFATFAAGLVIYWTWTNMLAVAQQYVIMRRMGVKPDIVGNLPFVGRKASQESAE